MQNTKVFDNRNFFGYVSNLINFQKKLPFPKMGKKRKNFKFVTKSPKHLNCLCNHARYSNFINIFETHCIQDNYPAQEPLFVYYGFVKL